MKEKIQEEKWIFPPMLSEVKNGFEVLFDVVFNAPDRKKPLMIMGDRGVGKSAFVEIFKTLYTRSNPGCNVKRMNISAIPESLLVSELFGHEKGSFTGATQKKRGHLETLGDGGLLILEEIGDISPEIQAKLLTFIEDGEYYAIGADKVKKAQNIQIIGTTNKQKPTGGKEDTFRQDFFDRFYFYTIPALHKRRKDILYYLKHFMRESMKNLSQYWVLYIMASHWAGNIREIETNVKLYKWMKEFKKQYPNDTYSATSEIPLIWDITNNQEHKDLEKRLKAYNLSLNYKDMTLAFPDNIPEDFNREFEGLELFCARTGKNICDNYHLLFPPRTESKKDCDITLFTHDDMEKHYLQKLLEKTGGNKTKAALRAGMKNSTFRDKINKHGIP